ncbi:CbrC family protein [Microbulbifer zhoushanensis]|uniref:CbrC family protein n=1 Tax=Microbulbifer zhoushanensis TaxID=2904254 RepID=UPI001F2CF0BF|nr:CbrC family protein [Microbulbifer zhoushanensis]
MKFKYFRKPEEFAFLTDGKVACSICGSIEQCFDTGGYSGVESIDCICPNCLKDGKLKELEIEANMNFDDGSEDAEIITYKTPALPTWQDTAWPYIDGKFPVFECIASKEDFKDEKEFYQSFLRDQNDSSDIAFLWERLPDKKLSNYKEAGDVSVYLFSLDGEKYWVWDAN